MLRKKKSVPDLQQIEITKRADLIGGIFSKAFRSLDNLGSSKVGEKAPKTHQQLAHVTANLRDLIRKDILSGSTPEKRLQSAEMWVKVMEENFKRKNLLAVDSIRSALTSPEIMRLSAYKNLSAGAKSFLNYLEEFYSNPAKTMQYMYGMGVDNMVPAVSAYKGILDKTSSDVVVTGMAVELKQIQQAILPEDDLKISKTSIRIMPGAGQEGSISWDNLAKAGNDDGKTNKELYSQSLMLEGRDAVITVKNESSFTYGNYDIARLQSSKKDYSQDTSFQHVDLYLRNDVMRPIMEAYSAYQLSLKALDKKETGKEAIQGLKDKEPEINQAKALLQEWKKKLDAPEAASLLAANKTMASVKNYVDNSLKTLDNIDRLIHTKEMTQKQDVKATVAPSAPARHIVIGASRQGFFNHSQDASTQRRSNSLSDSVEENKTTAPTPKRPGN